MRVPHFKPSDFPFGPEPPPTASWAARYAVGHPNLRRAIRNAFLPHKTKAEFEAWVVRRMPWEFIARMDQIEPAGDWMTWLMQAGRGAGKTKTGAEWSWKQVHRWPGFQHAVISPTFDDLDKVTFDGPSGLMRLVERFPHRVKKVLRKPWRIDFVNGSRINSFTGEAVERLRGPEHNCIAEGALIETDVGMVPIQDVKPGQKVMTRAGFCLVKGVICTGIRPVVRVRMDGRSVECTEDHRLWSVTRNRWVPADQLNTGEMVATRTFTGRATTGARTGITPGTLPGVEGHFTGLFSGLLSAKSPKDTTSIMAPVDRRTTVQRISLASREVSTEACMPSLTIGETPADGSRPASIAGLFSSMTPELQGFAAEPVSMLPESPTPSRSNDLARDAVGRSSPLAGSRGSAARHATTDTQDQSEDRSSNFVITAERPSPQDDQTPGIAAAIAQSRIVLPRAIVDVSPSRTCPVYDLQVEGAHEFIADGVVVHNSVWIDELAGMGKKADEVYTQASFGLRRMGPNREPPRMLLTSTPKPLPLFRSLNARFKDGDPAVIVTRASTMDNIANLSESAVNELRGRYEGTRLGRQELLGELLTDIPGALWTADMFLRSSMPPRLDRVVVAVDPSGAGSANSTSDAIGIVVIGAIFGKTKEEDRFFVIEDATLVASPRDWALRVAKAYDDWDADRVVAESNFGGAMVESVIKNAAPNIPVRLVTATRGKTVRAEPVAALYELGRVQHVGVFPDLEDQMMAMTVTGYVGEGSPDRADAAIWGMTDLMNRVVAPNATVGGGVRPSAWRPNL